MNYNYVAFTSSVDCFCSQHKLVRIAKVPGISDVGLASSELRAGSLEMVISALDSEANCRSADQNRSCRIRPTAGWGAAHLCVQDKIRVKPSMLSAVNAEESPVTRASLNYV